MVGLLMRNVVAYSVVVVVVAALLFVILRARHQRRTNTTAVVAVVTSYFHCTVVNTTWRGNISRSSPAFILSGSMPFCLPHRGFAGADFSSFRCLIVGKIKE